MAKIKISELESAITVNPADILMTIQGGTNKKLSLETLFGHLDFNTVINSKRTAVNLIVNGTQPNLFVTEGSTNKVSIGGIAAPESTLHVAGNIQLGGNVPSERNVQTISVGNNDSGGAGFKSVTITTTANHGFAVNNIVEIFNLSVAALEGPFTIVSTPSVIQFTYVVANATVTTGLNTTPPSAKAVVSTFREGIMRMSSDLLDISSEQTGTVQPIGISHSYTAIKIPASCNFSIPINNLSYVEKKIYLVDAPSGAVASINNVNGLGFSKVVLNSKGASVSLFFNGVNWIITGSNSAVIT